MSDRHLPTAHPESQSVSRRTVVKGAAWSVPVVMVAAAAPALAASGVSATSPGNGCHLNVNPKKQLRAYVTFTGPDGVAIAVTGVTTSISASVVDGSGSISGGQFVATIGLTTQDANDFGPRTLTIQFTAGGAPQTPAVVLIPSFSTVC